MGDMSAIQEALARRGGLQTGGTPALQQTTPGTPGTPSPLPMPQPSMQAPVLPPRQPQVYPAAPAPQGIPQPQEQQPQVPQQGINNDMRAALLLKILGIS